MDFNDFIAQQHQTNIHLSEGMVRVETLLAENSKRLFGGDGQPGALPILYTKIGDVEKKSDTVAERASALEGWKKNTLAWVAGAVAVITLEGTALAFYFNTVANHVKGH